MKPRTVVHAVHALIALAGALASQGCEDRSKPEPPPPKATQAPAPDNTARNARDASPGTPTADGQGQSESDVRITADIRRAIVADESLSMNAHNCKVITRGGVVTLRGPVETQAEKDAIATLARGVVGESNVVNELEIKS